MYALRRPPPYRPRSSCIPYSTANTLSHCRALLASKRTRHARQRQFSSSISPSLPEFVAKADAMRALEDDLEDKLRVARLGGGEKARERMKQKGKLLPRERLANILDPHTPFLEFSPLAAHDMYAPDTIPGAGLITGIGRIKGRECVIIVNDATVKGGAYYPMTVKKNLRAQEIARENRLACVYLVESGGAALPHQADVFPDREHFGRIFYNMAHLSRSQIPQLALIHGISVAGGAYLPALSDASIIVKNQGRIFLAGPPLVKAAIGEVVDDESLGGGEMHTSISGVADMLARNDEEGLQMMRELVGDLVKPNDSHASPPNEPLSPHYDSTELGGIVGTDVRHPFDMREVIARIVDDSEWHEFKSGYGESLICAFTQIHGYPIGLIANTSHGVGGNVIFSQSANKATHFIELCCQRRIPLVFFGNVNGYMIGLAAERGGIAKDGAKMVRAVACADVPKLTVVMGGSYGAGNYGMCGRAYSPRFLWMWPNAKISVMGSGQLSQVMNSVSRDPTQHFRLQETIESQSTAYYSTARLWDDGIIKPEDTRDVLGLALGVVWKELASRTETNRDGGGFGVFRM